MKAALFVNHTTHARTHTHAHAHTHTFLPFLPPLLTCSSYFLWKLRISHSLHGTVVVAQLTVQPHQGNETEVAEVLVQGAFPKGSSHNGRVTSLRNTTSCLLMANGLTREYKMFSKLRMSHTCRRRGGAYSGAAEPVRLLRFWPDQYFQL